MSRVRVGKKDAQTVIDTKKIGCICDSYILMHQDIPKEPSYVFTGMSAKKFLSALQKHDADAAFVSTENGDGGMRLNANYITQVHEHEVTMDFGSSEAASCIRTALSKEDMQYRIEHVHELVDGRLMGTEREMPSVDVSTPTKDEQQCEV